MRKRYSITNKQTKIVLADGFDSMFEARHYVENNYKNSKINVLPNNSISIDDVIYEISNK